ncbi:MAG TPA: hypothetical protein PLP48_07550 [Acholeplasmataceae bacterium]|nr:hypothetical protein [Acholeplasmataceae bacterium]
MKKRGLVISLLVLLAVITSGFTYAFWAASVSGASDTAVGTVEIGEGNAVTTSVTVGDETSAGQLVPVGRAASSQGTPVEYVILQFEVNWAASGTAADGATGTLAVTIDEVKIAGSTTNAGLVVTAYQIGGSVTGSTLNADGNNAITVNGSTVTVFVKVTLTEPTSQAQYNAINGEDITFNVNFVITATGNE